MEKKITIALVVLAFIGMSCNCNPKKGSKEVFKFEKKDSIHFGSVRAFEKYRDVFFVNGAIELNNGVAVKTKGRGINVWLDSLLYFSRNDTKFVAIASTLNLGYCILNYNGDSLFSEVISINNPTIKEYVTNKFNLISICDSSFNSGYIIKSVLLYRIGRDGILNGKKEYFPQKTNKGKYDFTIEIECYNDSIVIIKNGLPEFTYK